MTTNFWLWLCFIGMSAGGAAILAIGGRKTAREETTTVIHGIVPLIAACSYLAMIWGQGVALDATTAGGLHAYVFYFARYVDWLFTTPLLLTGLALTAMHAGMRRPGLLLGVLLADVMMIVTAAISGGTLFAAQKWIWFAISCGAFVAVYYVIFVGLKQEAARQRADVRDAFNGNALILSALWFAYPIVLALNPAGLNVLGATTSTALIVILDLSSKVAFGLYATVRHGAIAERDLREGRA